MEAAEPAKAVALVEVAQEVESHGVDEDPEKAFPFGDWFECPICVEEFNENQDAEASSALVKEPLNTCGPPCFGCGVDIDDRVSLKQRGVWYCPPHKDRMRQCADCQARLISKKAPLDYGEQAKRSLGVQTIVIFIGFIAIGGVLLLIGTTNDQYTVYSRPCNSSTYDTSSSADGAATLNDIPLQARVALYGAANPIQDSCAIALQLLRNLQFNVTSSLSFCGASSWSDTSSDVQVQGPNRKWVAFSRTFSSGGFVQRLSNATNATVPSIIRFAPPLNRFGPYLDATNTIPNVTLTLISASSNATGRNWNVLLNLPAMPFRVPTRECLLNQVTLGATSCFLYNHETAVASPYLFMVFGAAKVILFLILGNLLVTPWMITPLKTQWLFAKLGRGEMAAWPRVIQKFAGGIPAPADHLNLHRLFPKPCTPWGIEFTPEQRDLRLSEDGTDWRLPTGQKFGLWLYDNVFTQIIEHIINVDANAIRFDVSDEDVVVESLVECAVRNIDFDDVPDVHSPECLYRAVKNYIDEDAVAKAVAEDVARLLCRESTLPLSWVLSRTMTMLLAHHYTSFTFTGQGADAQWSPFYDPAASAKYRAKLQEEINASGVDLDLDRDVVAFVGTGDKARPLYYDDTNAAFGSFLAWHHGLARLEVRPVYSHFAQVQQQLADRATPGLLFVLIGLASVLAQVAYNVALGFEKPLMVDMNLYWRITYRLAQNGVVTSIIIKWNFYLRSLRYRRSAGEVLGGFTKVLSAVHWALFVLFFGNMVPMIALSIYYNPGMLLFGFDFFMCLIIAMLFIVRIIEISGRDRSNIHSRLANPLVRELIIFAIITVTYSLVISMAIQLTANAVVQQWLDPPDQGFIMAPFVNDISSRKVRCSAEGISDVLYQSLAISLLP